MALRLEVSAEATSTRKRTRAGRSGPSSSALPRQGQHRQRWPRRWGNPGGDTPGEKEQRLIRIRAAKQEGNLEQQESPVSGYTGAREEMEDILMRPGQQAQSGEGAS
jgi:hypothetical protein